jgi:hypothetical protein
VLNEDIETHTYKSRAAQQKYHLSADEYFAVFRSSTMHGIMREIFVVCVRAYVRVCVHVVLMQCDIITSGILCFRDYHELQNVFSIPFKLNKHLHSAIKP